MKTTSTLLCTLLAAQLAAQDLTHKAAPQRHPIVIENATIHPISSAVIENGTIWFDQGRIVGIHAEGDAPSLPANVERIDASGMHVFPGLIGANTTIGLQEVGSAPGTIDVAELGEITPEVRAAVAVNPDATAIPVTRSNGILTVAVHPFGGRGGGGALIPGRISAMHMDGWTWEEMTLEDDLGVLVNWPSLRAGRGRRGFGPRPSRSEDSDPAERGKKRRDQIDRTFRDAKAYFAARQADPELAVDLRLEGLADSIDGKRPVFLRADDAEQIQSAVAWAQELDLDPVIVGGREAGLCLDILVRHQVPVMVGGTHNLPSRRDSHFDEPFRLPSLLEQAKIPWCLSTRGEFSNERNLPYQAGTAVAYGLPIDAALRAITLSAAEILGIDDSVGSLQQGKLATLMITDGNPLEMTTKVITAFIVGKRIDLDNKHIRLAEKYREKYRQMGLIPRK